MPNRRASLFDTVLLGRPNLVALWCDDLVEPADKKLLPGDRVFLREILDPHQQQIIPFVAE